jgi:TATA-box binding protein (TBP) (component of TFIID and TFIIIB)
MSSLVKEQNGVIFSPYRVSTITCNANIGENVNIDLKLLFKNIHISDENNHFIWIQYLKEDIENTRGIYPKKQRKTKANLQKKNRFDNQITVIYKFNKTYFPNIKIFKNGNIQLTGIKDFDHTKIIVNNIISEIKRIYQFDTNILISSDGGDSVDNLLFQNFKVRMINTDFKIYEDIDMEDRFSIKRRELHNILIGDTYNNKSSFQPGVYQGVKLEYYWNTKNKEKNGICRCDSNCFGKQSGIGDGNCKKVTIAIFESGSILITGGITFEQVTDAYNYICKIISDNTSTIKKQVAIDLVI